MREKNGSLVYIIKSTTARAGRSSDAADRARWRTMRAERRGTAPPPFQQPPAPALPMPISHPLVRPRRAAAVRSNAAIDASLRAEAQTRLGKIKKTG